MVDDSSDSNSLLNLSDLPAPSQNKVEAQESNSSSENANSTEENEEKKSKPKRPHNIRGRRTRLTRPIEARPTQPPPSRPEFICRKSQDSQRWEIILSVDYKCHIKEVQHKGENLDVKNGEYSLLSFDGQLTIVSAEGKLAEISLFEDKPLIFKLRDN